MTSEFYWLIMMVGLFGLGAFLLLRYPHKIVQWQGRDFKKVYKGHLEMSDRDIDQLSQFPADRFFMGQRSVFIKLAPEHPEQFGRLIVLYRIFGVIFLLMLLLVVGILVILITAPQYQTV